MSREICHLTVVSLSGYISSIITANVFFNKSPQYFYCGYDKLNKIINEICDTQRGKKLIVSNFALKQEQYDQLINSFPDMVFIDHHFTSSKLKLGNNKNFIYTKSSSCLLVFKLFKKLIGDEELEERLKKLAILGNVYDRWLIDTKLFDIAYSLNELYWNDSDNFGNRFDDGYTKLTDSEKEFVNKALLDKKKRIKKLKRKDLDEKKAVLFIIDSESDVDLINDIQIVYPQWDIYFIYLAYKQKLTIKHKIKGKNVFVILEKLFKGREDGLFYSGDQPFGTLNYAKVTEEMFINDLKAIIDKF